MLILYQYVNKLNIFLNFFEDFSSEILVGSMNKDEKVLWNLHDYTSLTQLSRKHLLKPCIDYKNCSIFLGNTRQHLVVTFLDLRFLKTIPKQNSLTKTLYGYFKVRVSAIKPLVNFNQHIHSNVLFERELISTSNKPTIKSTTLEEYMLRLLNGID